MSKASDRRQAAEDLIRATDQLRELTKAGKVTPEDAAAVADANRRLDGGDNVRRHQARPGREGSQGPTKGNGK